MATYFIRFFLFDYVLRQTGWVARIRVRPLLTGIALRRSDYFSVLCNLEEEEEEELLAYYLVV